MKNGLIHPNEQYFCQWKWKGKKENVFERSFLMHCNRFPTKKIMPAVFVYPTHRCPAADADGTPLSITGIIVITLAIKPIGVGFSPVVVGTRFIRAIPSEEWRSERVGRNTGTRLEWEMWSIFRWCTFISVENKLNQNTYTLVGMQRCKRLRIIRTNIFFFSNKNKNIAL